MADQGDALAGLNVQREVFQNRFLLRIAETDLVKNNTAAQILYGLLGYLADRRFGVDQGEGALGGRPA